MLRTIDSPGTASPAKTRDARLARRADVPPCPATDAERLAFLMAPAAAPPPRDDGTLALFRAGGPRGRDRGGLSPHRRGRPAARPRRDRLRVARRTRALVWDKALRLDWPVTLGAGHPGSRSRGPAARCSAFCDWIDDDFAAGRAPAAAPVGRRARWRSRRRPARRARPRALLARAGATWGRATYAAALARLSPPTSSAARPIRRPTTEPPHRRASAPRRPSDSPRAIDALAGPRARPDDEARSPLRRAPRRRAAASSSASPRAQRARRRRPAAALDDALGELRALGDLRCPLPDALRFVRDRVEGLTVGAIASRPGHLHVSPLAARRLRRPSAHLRRRPRGRPRVSGRSSRTRSCSTTSAMALIAGLATSRDRVGEAVYRDRRAPRGARRARLPQLLVPRPARVPRDVRVVAAAAGLPARAGRDERRRTRT